MAHPADRVFHTLELAQHIVHHLEEKDLFLALGITKALWKSKEPVSAWREYIRRLGYADSLIDQYTDRYHLRDIYLRICRSADAISRGTNSECKRIDIRGEDQDDSLVCMGKQDVHYLSRQVEEDEIDIYTLDHRGMKLLHKGKNMRLMSCFDKSSRLLGNEDDEIVVRNIKDWSLSGSYGPYRPLQEWWTQGRHVLTFHVTNEGETSKTIFEVWDAYGVKRGELAHPGYGYSYHDLEKPGESLMATGSERHIRVWDLDTLKCVYEYSAPEENPGAMLELHQNIVYYTRHIGLWFTDFWTTDGSPITRARAELVTRANSSWCKFSDGTMITYPWDLTLCDPEGVELFAIDCNSNREETYELDAGILFDRFFFLVIKMNEREEGVVKPAELKIYAKDGEELGSTILRKGGRTHRWFVDIFGRLVFIYLDRNDALEELEVVDFCRWAKVATRRKA
ncbi:hypothetical protein CEP54_002044 [Fusarium duplospermum]|uniref:F-box domain-containing protein n=1 Tax=Fusarium duplospermum TaxID=1325734 RepID=A0A428QXV3_9HYPO|nr:hypothetical protein CEP54_002044 [Fusarium duplospermum]